MTVAFSSVLNQDGAKLSESFKKSAGRQVLKPDFKMVTGDGLHRCQANLTLQKAAGLRRTLGGIYVWQQYRHGRCHIMTAEGLKVDKVAKTTSAIVWPDMSFIDLLTSMVSYAHAFRSEYQVRFLDARMNDIVEDMISSDFLSPDSRSTFVLNICVERLV